MPTTRQETKKIEQEEVQSEGSETSEDPNFEIPESLIDMDEDDDLYDILSTFFTTEDGDNICTALMGIKDALDTQNKILMKIAVSFSKKSEA